MDRRVVAGLVGLFLSAIGGEASAQSVPARDPSTQPPVGLGPLRSINDTINSIDVPTNPNVVPMASARTPISPVGSGPSSVIPNPPVLNEPVSLTPFDPIQHSVSHGFGSGRVASLFRKPGARPTAPASAPRFLPSYSALGGSANFARPPAVASPATDPLALPPVARPAPYAGQNPEMPRPQADPVVVPASTTGDGRPAPYSRAIPRDPRPQGPTDGRPAATPRPQLDPANPSTVRPNPVVTPPSGLEPVAAPAELPVVVPTNPIELPPPPPLGTIPPTLPENPEPASPSPTVGMVPVAPSSLPALEVVTTPVAPSTPVVVANELPPEGLPVLASVDIPAKAVIPEAPVAPSQPVDDQIQRTSVDEAALKIKDTRKTPGQEYITFRAAAVGDEIITINELTEAVNLKIAEIISGQNVPPNAPELRNLKSQVAAATLNNLIEERLILHELKSKMTKNPKNEQAFNEFVSNIWKTEELPILNRKYGTNNVHELKIKMREAGQNYDAKKEIFCKREMARQFLNGEIRNLVTCDLMEQKAFYNLHVAEFDKPARMTWREIEVDVRRYPDRATARKKADELLARLLHDESFEAIARASSNGPTASEGGVYVDMQPGSYGIPSVNEELNRIPVGQVSRVIEAPTSFHIIRVDSRRDKGPLHFAEVQDLIKRQVFMDNFQKATSQYIAKLRSKTLIRSMFEVTPEGLVASSGPPGPQKIDPAVQPASGTR